MLPHILLFTLFCRPHGLSKSWASTLQFAKSSRVNDHISITLCYAFYWSHPVSVGCFLLSLTSFSPSFVFHLLLLLFFPFLFFSSFQAFSLLISLSFASSSMSSPPIPLPHILHPMTSDSELICSRTNFGH